MEPTIGVIGAISTLVGAILAGAFQLFRLQQAFFSEQMQLGAKAHEKLTASIDNMTKGFTEVVNHNSEVIGECRATQQHTHVVLTRVEQVIAGCQIREATARTRRDDGTAV